VAKHYGMGTNTVALGIFAWGYIESQVYEEKIKNRSSLPNMCMGKVHCFAVTLLCFTANKITNILRVYLRTKLQGTSLNYSQEPLTSEF
jgi:hypothetical protein